MTTLLETTVPSDFDTTTAWYLTLGKAEHEDAAWALTRYLQIHGDVWRPADPEKVGRHSIYGRSVAGILPADERGMVTMPEAWLRVLTESGRGVRVMRPGPPSLRLWLFEGARGRSRRVLQLVWPNGRVLAASFCMPEDMVIRLELNRFGWDRDRGAFIY